MTYQNGISLYANNKHLPIGDPFILRHNGMYYLYPSTEAHVIGIHVFTSTNLVDWTYQGKVTEDEVTKGAYAPEVIYAYQKFYMCTSPGGNGHYLFTADSPLGPFKRITNNIGEMIDGTFYLDKHNKLYFGRADHRGIVINQMTKNGQISGRKNLHAPINGWTEGPFFIDNKDLKLMTYCGNFLLSKGYHVDYATSKTIDGSYQQGINNPLIISTKDDYYALGHSMTIIGPNLYDYYVAYHQLYDLENGGTFRNLAIDRLQINGRLLAVNATNQEQEKPQRPTFESYHPLKEGFTKVGNYYLCKQDMTQKFAAEFNFNDDKFEIILDYQNETSYKRLCLKKNVIVLLANEQTYTINHHFDVHSFKTIRLISDEKAIDVYIDHVYLGTFDISLQGGRFGFKTVTKHVYYIGYSQIQPSQPITIPGTYLMNPQDSLKQDPTDETYYDELVVGEQRTYWIQSETSSTYTVSFYGDILEEAVVSLQDKHYVIKRSSSTYQDNTLVIGELTCKKGSQPITIKVIKGTVKLKAIRFEQIDQKTTMMNQLEEKDIPYVKWLDNGKFKSFEWTFKYYKMQHQKRVGLMINVSDYSFHHGQTDHGYVGYFIGFRDSLLVLDKAQYGLTRIYDKPYALDLEKEITITVHYESGHFIIYVNHELAFETYDAWSYQLGHVGFYLDPYVEAKLLSYNFNK